VSERPCLCEFPNIHRLPSANSALGLERFAQIHKRAPFPISEDSSTTKIFALQISDSSPHEGKLYVWTAMVILVTISISFWPLQKSAAVPAAVPFWRVQEYELYERRNISVQDLFLFASFMEYFSCKSIKETRFCVNPCRNLSITVAFLDTVHWISSRLVGFASKGIQRRCKAFCLSPYLFHLCRCVSNPTPCFGYWS